MENRQNLIQRIIQTSLLKRRTLSFRLKFLFTLIIAIVVILLTIISNNAFRNSFMSHLEQFNLDTVNNTVTIVDSTISPFELISFQLMSDTEIREMLNVESTDYQSVINLNRFNAKLSTLVNQIKYNDVISISVISPTIKYTFGKESLELAYYGYENELYNSFRDAKGKFIMVDAGEVEFSDNTKEEVFICGRLIRDMNLREKGYIAMYIKKEVFQKALDNMEFGEQYTFGLRLNSGQYLYKVEEKSDFTLLEKDDVWRVQEIGATFKQNGQYYTSFMKESESYGYKAVNVVPLSSLTKSLITIRNLTILVAVILLVLGIFLAVSVSNDIVHPINTIIDSVNGISSHSDLAQRIDTTESPELNQLVEQLNTMLERIQSLIAENEEAHRALISSELSALRYQINPHFIYNTLNSIRWLAIINKQPQIKKITENFSQLIMNTLSETGELVPLSDEIEFAESYVSIMKIRYEAFDQTLDVPEKLRHALVPKFILQPFIENSILHGFKNIDRRGIIKITAQALEDELILEIADNGSGLGSKKKASPQRRKTQGSSHKIGIENVNKRLQLRFGENYGVSMQEDLPYGTKVVVVIPLLLNDKKGDAQNDKSADS